jgi:8-hydroxy-5-deazaflavin:NADPH oxidoreductase
MLRQELDMNRRESLATLAASAVAVSVLGETTLAQDDKTIAVIGTGRMGGAFGKLFSEAGYKVIYGSRNPADEKVQSLVRGTNGGAAMSAKDAAAKAGIIVVATPWNATEATIKGMGDLTGKLILDPTNAIQFGKDGASMSVDTSGGELLRDWAKGASVVKAFNTVGYFVIADPKVLADKVAVFLASDDAAAKDKAMAMVNTLGFEGVDVGGMKNARVLEGMSILYMVPFMTNKQDQRFEWAVRRSGGVKLGPVRPAG